MREMKDSGIEWIGEIPKSKNVIRNKYMFTYEKGKLPNSTNLEKSGFPYIGASDLDSASNEYATYTDDETLPNAEYDDLLVLWDGARAGLCGTHKIGKVSSTIVRIRGNHIVFQPFLYWYYKGFESFMYQSVNGTTIPHMNKKYIEQINFIDWTLEEQQAISTYLDTKCEKIDSIIARQQEVIEKLKAYKLSVITEAVTKGLNPDVRMKDSGVEWIGDVPEHWEITKFKYLSLEIGDGIHTTPEYDPAGSIYFINGNNIGFDNLVFKDNTNTINEDEYKNYKPSLLTMDTILITLNGATYGKTSFYNGEKVLLGKSAGYITLKPNENKRFVRYYLQSNAAKLIMEISLLGSTIANLSLNTLKNFSMSYPPLNEQCEIVEYLDKKCSAIDSAITKKQAIIEKLTAYKKSLIYEVVTGKREVYAAKKSVAVICPVGIPTNEKEYARMLLMQKIITRCGDKLKGRTHLMKIFHAMELEMGFSFRSEYTRHFHGPYDKKIVLYENALARKGWIRIKKGKNVEYIVVNPTAYKNDYKRIFSDYNREIERIIDFFKSMKRTSKAEKVATLLASWNDFLIDGIAEPTDDMIINDVMNNWTDNKKKIPYETWQEILNQMRKAKIVPHGYGRHTTKMED